MSKVVKFLISLGVLFLIIYGIYKVFFGCEKVITHFDQIFTLERSMDYATIDSEVIIKYIGIDDNRCKESDCEREGEKVAKLLVVNNHRISYVKLGTLVDTELELEKLGYKIELISISEDNKIELKIIEI